MEEICKRHSPLSPTITLEEWPSLLNAPYTSRVMVGLFTSKSTKLKRVEVGKLVSKCLSSKNLSTKIRVLLQ